MGNFAHIILRNRITLLAVLLFITIFMAYQAQKIKWSYNIASIVPDTDEEMIYFKQFKNLFGEDGNILALGIKDSSIYSLEKFKAFKILTQSIQIKEGVNDVLGLANLKMLEKNPTKKIFDYVNVFERVLKNRKELDSLLRVVKKLKFYSGQLLNLENGATLLLITVDKDVLNSENRDELIASIIHEGSVFEKNTNIKVHYAGLPYVRATNTSKVKKELNMFLLLSVIVTIIILFLFFRSIKAVLVPIIIIGVVVVWVLGTLSMLEYRITLFTGLIPPIIVVIGIPNCVYMLNSYHLEFTRHGNKIKALSRVLKKIGVVTFMTNITTAIGFFVLTSTNIKILSEFGIVTGLNIVATYIVSIILIPTFFSFFDSPTAKNLNHLKKKSMKAFIQWIDISVHKRRKAIFLVSFVVIVVSFYGVSKIKVTSFMSDDIPRKSELKKDLEFFETNFNGILPLELIIDTGTRKGVKNLKTLKKIDELETFISSSPYISQPVSVVSFLKAARQAFYNQNEEFYSLPNSRDFGHINKYLESAMTKQEQDFSKSFVDSTGRIVRISLKMADIGSDRLDSLVTQTIQPKIDSLFSDSKVKVKLTGSTLMFINGNKFLVQNLFQSMLMAFLIIAVLMGLLFKNLTIISISVISNVIPLIVTAGIMGFFDVPMKPSSGLVFSVVFGIAIDDSIHFLSKYRHEIIHFKYNVSKAVSRTIRETGSSMIYTSIILFFGFIIFVLSEFGGTVVLGALTSITLLVAMFTNVFLLPALLLQFDKKNKSRQKK